MQSGKLLFQSGNSLKQKIVLHSMNKWPTLGGQKTDSRLDHMIVN